MLRFEHTEIDSERVEEWPDGRKVTHRTRKRVREIGLDSEILKALRGLSVKRVAEAVLRELAPRLGLFLLLRELLAATGIQP